MISVFIADSYPLIREGLRHVISTTGDIVVVGEASTDEEALAGVRGGGIDVVVLGLNGAGLCGFEILQQLMVERPDLPVLVLSTYPEDLYGTQALRMGADGYLVKNEKAKKVIKAIRTIARGQKYIGSCLAQQLAKTLYASPDRPLYEALSKREFDVMLRIARGERNQEVARALAISSKTVCTYRAHILAKLGLGNDVQIARYALAHGLVE